MDKPKCWVKMSFKFLTEHCKNECATVYGNRLQAILVIKYKKIRIE